MRHENTIMREEVVTKSGQPSCSVMLRYSRIFCVKAILSLYAFRTIAGIVITEVSFHNGECDWKKGNLCSSCGTKAVQFNAIYCKSFPKCLENVAIYHCYRSDKVEAFFLSDLCFDYERNFPISCFTVSLSVSCVFIYATLLKTFQRLHRRICGQNPSKGSIGGITEVLMGA